MKNRILFLAAFALAVAAFSYADWPPNCTNSHPDTCTDGCCSGENKTTAQTQFCAACCGDGYCDAAENSVNCSQDCGSTTPPPDPDPLPNPNPDPGGGWDLDEAKGFAESVPQLLIDIETMEEVPGYSLLNSLIISFVQMGGDYLAYRDAPSEEYQRLGGDEELIRVNELSEGLLVKFGVKRQKQAPY